MTTTDAPTDPAIPGEHRWETRTLETTTRWWQCVYCGQSATVSADVIDADRQGCPANVVMFE